MFVVPPTCGPCGLAGLQCNGGEPCSGCIERGAAHNCFRPVPPRRKGRPRRRSTRDEQQSRPKMQRIRPQPTDPGEATATTIAPTPLDGPAHNPPAKSSSAAESGADTLVVEAFNAMAKRMRQLEDENARVKKRQRKTRRALHELRSLVHAHLGATLPPPSQDNTSPIAAAATPPPNTAAQPQPSSPPQAVICSPAPGSMQIQREWCFPFLRSYDMRGKAFVADDHQKPVLVFSFKERPVYANPQMCRLVGFSQEEILGDRLELVLATRTKFSFQRTLLGVWEKMGVSDVRQSVLELLGQSGDLIKVQAGVQFFYGLSGHLRCTVLCVERVLGVTRPPWTLGDDPVGEEEHQRRLGLYREAIRQREEREWRLVEASYYDPLFPAAAAAAASPPATAVVAGGDHQPLPQAWDKEFLQFFV